MTTAFSLASYRMQSTALLGRKALRWLTTWLVLAAAPAWLAAQNEIVYVPGESVVDPALKTRLAELGGEGARRFVIALTDAAELEGVDLCLAPGSDQVHDSELRRAIDAADVLELRGGSFVGWYKTLHPPSTRTHLARALSDHLAAKKPLLVFGGACQFLSGGVSVSREQLEKELKEIPRNPHDTDEFEARLAYRSGPPALFEADVWSQGTPRRLLHALHETHVDFGFHAIGDVVLWYARDTSELTVHGPGEVLVFDLQKCRRGRDFVDQARLHRLLDGDRWEFTHRRPRVAEARSSSSPGSGGRDVQDRAEALTRAEPPTGLEFSRWLNTQAESPAKRREMRVGDWTWTLSWNSQSESFGTQSGSLGSQSGSSGTQSGSSGTTRARSHFGWPLRIQWAGR